MLRNRSDEESCRGSRLDVGWRRDGFLNQGAAEADKWVEDPRARAGDAGFHKRMMIIATAMPLPAAIDRMAWLPTTLPSSALAPDLYVLLALAPMFAWDVLRNRAVHRAYWIFIPIYLAASLAVNLLWDTSTWHATAHQIMGV